MVQVHQKMRAHGAGTLSSLVHPAAQHMPEGNSAVKHTNDSSHWLQSAERPGAMSGRSVVKGASDFMRSQVEHAEAGWPQKSNCMSLV